jgi:hypothetical protein
MMFTYQLARLAKWRSENNENPISMMFSLPFTHLYSIYSVRDI